MSNDWLALDRQQNILARGTLHDVIEKSPEAAEYRKVVEDTERQVQEDYDN